MKIHDVPLFVTDWKRITPTEHPGASGVATARTFEAGNIRVRMVEYSPGYMADHWCSRGHVVLVLEGEVVIEQKDGNEFSLIAGMSCQMEDDENKPHRSYSEQGAKMFIVD